MMIRGEGGFVLWDILWGMCFLNGGEVMHNVTLITGWWWVV